MHERSAGSRGRTGRQGHFLGSGRAPVAYQFLGPNSACFQRTRPFLSRLQPTYKWLAAFPHDQRDPYFLRGAGLCFGGARALPPMTGSRWIFGARARFICSASGKIAVFSTSRTSGGGAPGVSVHASRGHGAMRQAPDLNRSRGPEVDADQCVPAAGVANKAHCRGFFGGIAASSPSPGELAVMAQVIDQLVRDHRNMALLLDIIEEEIDAYRRDHVPDFDLLRVMAEYTLNYPDRVHHPRENLVLERLVERDPAAGEAVGNLVAEHARLAELTLEFAKAMNAAANDVELSREWFDALAAEYLSANRRHMQVEETQFFPRALSVLTGDDWAEIDQLTARPNDPLFGDKVTKAYLFLHERILQSHG